MSVILFAATATVSGPAVVIAQPITGTVSLRFPWTSTPAEGPAAQITGAVL